MKINDFVVEAGNSKGNLIVFVPLFFPVECVPLIHLSRFAIPKLPEIVLKFITYDLTLSLEY